jgi:multidrug efflux pump
LGLEWAGIRGLPAGVTGALPWVASLPAALLGWYVGRLLNAVLRWGFRYFDRGFTASIGLYLRGVEGLLRVTPVVLVIYAGLLVVTWWGFRHMPKGFIPTQDMGYLMVNIQLPDAAAAERTRQTVNRIETITLATPGVKHTLSVSGSSLLLNATGSHLAFLFVILDDFSNRRAPELYSDAIAARLRAAFTDQIPEARVTVLPAPPIRGIGRTGGLRMMVEDRGDLGPQMLQQQVDNLVDKGRRLPELVDPVSVFQANAPQLFADVNRSQCISMGVPLEAVFNTLQTYLGSLHVNDFNRFGRTWRVIVQADSKFRRQVDTIRQLKVRNKDGQMVPLGAVADIRQTNGPLVLTRYNMYPAAAINANAAPGVSSGTAISQMQALAGRELPAAMASEWTELAYLQLQAGNTAMVLFGLAVVMVFLVLAAQYESWSLPMAVILVVPMCLLSAIAGVAAARMDINIFTQVGFVVLVGLASKNAILIVEYAKRQRELGTPRHEAAMAACQLRLRPIVMTSAAFILGVSPLLFARGAGAEMRRTLGTAVFSGMLGVTLFGIFLTPVFFVVIDRLSQSGFFQSRPMRWLRGLSLTVFALGFLRFAARHAAGLGGAVIRRINNSQK